MFKRSLLALLVLPLLVLIACDEDGDVNVVNTPPTPTETVTVLIGGQCRTSGSSIECEDDSRSVPADQLSSVSWDLRDASSGISIDRKPGQPGGEISFSGLAPGEYSVEQTVAATDGSAAEQVHGNLAISP